MGGWVAGRRLGGQARTRGCQSHDHYPTPTTASPSQYPPSHHLEHTYLIQPPPCSDLGRVGEEEPLPLPWVVGLQGWERAGQGV